MSCVRGRIQSLHSSRAAYLYPDHASYRLEKTTLLSLVLCSASVKAGSSSNNKLVVTVTMTVVCRDETECHFHIVTCDVCDGLYLSKCQSALYRTSFCERKVAGIETTRMLSTTLRGWIPDSFKPVEMVFPEDIFGTLQIVIVVVLSAITIFRRQISCNRCYNEVDNEKRNTVDTDASAEDHQIIPGTKTFVLAPLLGKVWTVLGLCSDILTTMYQDCSHRLNMLLTPTEPPENILDLAGCFASGYPYTASLLHPKRTVHHHMSAGDHLDIGALPCDSQLHILSFLHPKDILSLACVNQACHNLVDGNSSSDLDHCDDGSPVMSRALWKKLWYRDYAWLVHSWDVGRVVLDRCGRSEPVVFTKEFYFRFSLTYMNHVLAGQNTFDRCLVGIGGHIYDLSLFLTSHPGSPETVMAHAGKDATKMFDSMKHSSGARRLAKTLCVVVDKSFLHKDSCGAFPTEATMVYTGPSECIARDLPATYTSWGMISRKGTLDSVKCVLQKELRDMNALVKAMEVPDTLGDVNVYYDSIVGRWKAWYTNNLLETVFIEQIEGISSNLSSGNGK